MTASFPSLADSLIQALHQPGQERLLDLVRNPLRLTLLCITWDGTLPETQAQLYENYLKKFYDWNQNLQELRNCAERCQTNITALKKQLNQQLGELAKAALDLPQERLRLSQSLVEKYLGEELDDKSLCYLALQLGWLNRVGKDKRGQFIFAFYHATFQEYFAALAVDDWDYFLPRNHVNFPVSGKEYRIFESRWKQVILLWLGRGDISNKEKDTFIGTLKNFDKGKLNFYWDGEYDFYWDRAICLAAAGIAEFYNCMWADEIMLLIIEGAFGYFDEQNCWHTGVGYLFNTPFMVALQETDRNRAIAALSDLLNCNIEAQEDLCDIATYLLRISPGNPKAIKTLTNLLDSKSPHQEAWLDWPENDPPHQMMLEKAAFWLLQDNPDSNNSKAIQILLKPQRMNWDTWQHLLANDINAMSKLLEASRLQHTLEEEINYSDYYLKRSKIGNADEVITIIEEFRNSQGLLAEWPNDVWKLEFIGLDNSDAIKFFMELAYMYENNTEKKHRYMDTLRIIGKIGANDREAINYLLNIINRGESFTQFNAIQALFIQFSAIQALRYSLHGNLLAIIVQALKKYCQNRFEENISDQLLQIRQNLFACYVILWHCSQKMPYPDFYRAWHGLTEN